MHRCRRGASDREVHGRTRCRRRLYRQHDLLGHGVDSPRPWLRLAGSSLIATSHRTHPSRMTEQTMKMTVHPLRVDDAPAAKALRDAVAPFKGKLTGTAARAPF